jgi:hypothetical protein
MALMRPKVTAAQRKQLLDRRSGSHHKQRGGVMVVPGIAPSIAAWEAVAVPQQTRLLAEAHDEMHGAHEARIQQQTEVKV